MSSTQDLSKQTASNNDTLEGGADFGSEKLNNFYKSLDRSVQLKVRGMNRESAIQLLEIMSNPNIQQVYDGLTDKEKADLKKMGLVNKYTTLKKMLDKKVQETTFVLSAPKSPSSQPKAKFSPRTPEGPHDDPKDECNRE